MILKLRKINVLKLAFFFALLYALLSVLILVPITLIGSLITGEGAVGLGILILFPIMYGIGGFIGGLIMGGFYNLTSKWIGGLEFEFEKIEKFTE